MSDSAATFRVAWRHDEDAASEPGTEAGEEVFIIDDSLGYLANRLARALARTLTSCLVQHGISIGQWGVLLILWAQDGLSQKELSQGVAIEAATMVRSLDRMERDGLVRRVRNPRDRRQINVFLTEKGWDLRDVLIPCAIAGNATATRTLAGDEQRDLLELMRQVLAALEASPDSDGVELKGNR